MFTLIAFQIPDALGADFLMKMKTEETKPSIISQITRALKSGTRHIVIHPHYLLCVKCMGSLKMNENKKRDSNRKMKQKKIISSFPLNGKSFVSLQLYFTAFLECSSWNCVCVTWLLKLKRAETLKWTRWKKVKCMRIASVIN